jgi:thioredoxin reductase
MEIYDVLVVGGGPAGLSAALILGRCRRRVLLCDAGEPRNAASHALHGFLSRDGVPPRELVRLGRAEVCGYGVEIRDIEVVDAWSEEGSGFAAVLADGDRVRARRIVLATGMDDEIPCFEGIAERYGRSVFHCPYCDGWESRDQPLAACARGPAAVRYVLLLARWSDDVVLCTHGPADLDAGDRDVLARNGIRIREEPIARLEGPGGALTRIVFSEREPLPRARLFLKWGERQKAQLAAKLGLSFTPEGTVETGKNGRTGVDGVYVIGDASPMVQLVIVAAAEGAMAAVEINGALTLEDAGVR